MAHRPPRLLVQVSAPATEPLTLAEAKLYLRVDGSEEDTLITALISTVRELAEEHLRRSLITQSWKLVYDDAAPACTPLPRGPVNSITSVVLVARDESTSTFAAGNYYLRADSEALIFDATPISHRVEITYSAGYGASVSDIPEAIRHGMLAHLASLYEQRGEGSPAMPETTRSLYAPFRPLEIA